MTIQTIRQKPKYKDFYTNFEVKGSTTGRQKGDLYVLTDADAVKQSIRNIILTDPNERMFNPTFGGGVRRSLFENITMSSIEIIKTQIKYTIMNYEKRAKLVSVNVVAAPDENRYDVTITFSVINNTNVEKLDLILYRVR